mgnify:FL=1
MSFSMFPNPANDLLVIQLDNLAQDALLLINDVSGRVVFEKHIEFGELRLNFSVEELSSGLYSVQLHSGNRVGVLPLIIQR